MTTKDCRVVSEAVRDEGFDYAMQRKEDGWSRVRDHRFHALRDAYLRARLALLKYCDVTES